MAYDITGFSYTLKASADFTTKQYYAVVVDTNGEASLAGAGVNIDGVIQGCSDVDEAVTVVQTGITKFVAGAIITAGDELETNGNGEAITNIGGPVIGKALGSAGASGEIISVLLY
jgi:hypothetical protein